MIPKWLGTCCNHQHNIEYLIYNNRFKKLTLSDYKLFLYRTLNNLYDFFLFYTQFLCLKNIRVLI